MHLHIIGICGTFMGGIAALARATGHRVTGSDRNVYPPMSTQLAALGIDVIEGYQPDQVKLEPDVFVIGNVMSRGNPLIEAVLDSGRPYESGPEWLARNVLKGRWVLAVAGTHGKTTTSSLLTSILEHAGLEPGFLVGGVPLDFDVSARLGSGRHFVVEADEYDTAFFDKRAKFVHYRPRTAILNNLEHDHADIYPDVASIQRQFHLLLRTVPGNGRLVVQRRGSAISPKCSAWAAGRRSKRFASDAAVTADWHLVADPAAAYAKFAVYRGERRVGDVEWGLLGRHNAENGLAALVAAHHAGVDEAVAIEALCRFRGVRRRLEVRGTVDGVRRVRRLRASPDGGREHARGRAPQGGRGARHRRARAAFQHDEARYAQGGAGGFAARRGSRLRLQVAGREMGRRRRDGPARQSRCRPRGPRPADGGDRRGVTRPGSPRPDEQWLVRRTARATARGAEGARRRLRRHNRAHDRPTQPPRGRHAGHDRRVRRPVRTAAPRPPARRGRTRLPDALQARADRDRFRDRSASCRAAHAEIARYLGELYGAAPGQLSVFGQEEWTAPVASGSATSRAMVVCPCSMGTVASLAQGASRTLIERAGDVMLKERRPLIVVPRETPFSTIHLENLLRLAQAGALILPANPGFYHRPSKAEDLVDYIVARILDHLGIEHALGPRWGVDRTGLS